MDATLSPAAQTTMSLFGGVLAVLLAASFAACVAAWGWAMGPVGWFGQLSLAGFALVLLLTAGLSVFIALWNALRERRDTKGHRAIARGLIGKSMGDTVEIRTPKGATSYEIVEVVFE